MLGTRERIVDASSELFRRQGYASTGMKQIVERANAPFGSVYHFFPGGKEQIGEEVVRWSGAQYLELIEAIFDAATNVAVGTNDFFLGAAWTVEESDFADACPIATLALEVASTNDPLRQATADVFESRIADVTRRYSGAGIGRRARALAEMAFCALEGAFLLSRASRDVTPIKTAGRFVSAAVRDELRLARRARRR
jgi:AcrR family transcriptional regulator